MTNLGLPTEIQACLFDLDGVITRTAGLHAAAWKDMFDEFLKARFGQEFRPFDQADYDRYVDGRPRADGVRTFLASRGVELPEGTPSDPADADTVRRLAERKNELLLARIRQDGVQAYDDSLDYVRAVRGVPLRTAVVSSSKNCQAMLRAIGAEELFEVRIDGTVAEARGLQGKPAPDTFLAAAHELGVAPAACAVFEDALAGMEAGRSGHFGYVVGVDRADQAADLRSHGADTVVEGLSALRETR
ncbi:HAD family phosphatase [Streptomyces sp. NBC_00687]|uniref:HAD family hydrolase n=1 Tax=Streptomyces sp. NBC_00687 TaxID=2975807 RepID=UPI0022543A87|nr:beta-phosphoglucomutase family hydrolase [Streptomyces sp. NBC_00687]MCX4912169.1 beta-phosphoglucomutase family hydrolase [Streptomyces sp. NBC_00687]